MNKTFRVCHLTGSLGTAVVTKDENYYKTVFVWDDGEVVTEAGSVEDLKNHEEVSIVREM